MDDYNDDWSEEVVDMDPCPVHDEFLIENG